MFDEFLIIEVPDYERRFCFLTDRAALLPRSEDRGKYSGITLGGYRRGKMLPTVGGVVERWVACARMEVATGVPWPHAYFLTVGGHMYCPACVAEAPWTKPRTEAPKPQKPTNQMSLF